MKTSIRTIWGTFWHLDSNSKVIQTTSDDHKFELVSLGNGNIAFRGPNNKFVCAEDEGKADYLVCDRDGSYAWEEFKPEPDYGGQAYKGVNGRYIAAEDTATISLSIVRELTLGKRFGRKRLLLIPA
jgi:hypothetical protein